jgi:HEPN domain-containing protein
MQLILTLCFQGVIIQTNKKHYEQRYMDKIVEKWVERSEYDLETARAMLNASRYLYVAYTCQQAIEKALKALIAHKNIENLPIHNLNRLAEIAGIMDELTPDQFDFLAELTPYNTEARYGDYKESLNEIINKEKAEILFKVTERTFKWILQKID